MQQNGGKLLVDSLVALGATRAFGVPGESYLAVLDALFDAQGTLDFTLCRQEGGAAFMAAAYGKLTGQPGICFVTRGPGVTNASIGVHTAMQDSVPMILFVGQVGTDMKGREAFQEIDYKAVFGTMVKWVVEIDQVDRLPELLMRAWARATTGRPGPVVVALPEDMLTSKTPTAPLQMPFVMSEPRPAPDDMARVYDMLMGAKRPMIIYGGCNWTDHGAKLLQSFAETHDIPVAAVFRYQDQFDNHSPCFIGEMGVAMFPYLKMLVKDADLILAVNMRFGENSTDGYCLFDVPQPKQRLIHVHGSDLELGKIYQPELAIQAGPKAFSDALNALPLVKGDWGNWRIRARENYEKSFELNDLPSPVDMGKICSYLRDHLPKDAIVTNGAGNFAVWSGRFIKYGPDMRLLAPQSGAMGYGLPAAIAAKVVHPDRCVVCFAGDGDFQMTLNELATAQQSGAQPIVIIVNNGIYGTIRAHQEHHYPNRVSGTTMTVNPDFTALARAYGFHGERVEKTEDFAAAFERAMTSSTGAVLDLNVSPEALTPRKTLSQIRDGI